MQLGLAVPSLLRSAGRHRSACLTIQKAPPSSPKMYPQPPARMVRSPLRPKAIDPVPAIVTDSVFAGQALRERNHTIVRDQPLVGDHHLF